MSVIKKVKDFFFAYYLFMMGKTENRIPPRRVGFFTRKVLNVTYFGALLTLLSLRRRRGAAIILICP